MLKTIEGVYRDGKVELMEVPTDVRDETRVLATFLISAAPTAAAPLKEDWDSRKMLVYDDYDAAKAHSRTRRCNFRAVAPLDLHTATLCRALIVLADGFQTGLY